MLLLRIIYKYSVPNVKHVTLKPPFPIRIRIIIL